MLHAIRAPCLVGVNEYFGIGSRAKPVPERLKLRPQLAKIVNFAVVNNRARPVLIPDGLTAARQINNAQPPHSQHSPGRGQQPVFIRSAMDKPRHHPPHERLRLPRIFHADRAADSAHRFSSSPEEMSGKRAKAVGGI